MVKRTPRHYDGTGVTTHQISNLLDGVLSQVQGVISERADLVLAAWPEVIGPKLAGMTQAVSFTSGVMVVKVKNSTLHSLLSQNDKPRILNNLRKKFPNVAIKEILFRIG